LFALALALAPLLALLPTTAQAANCTTNAGTVSCTFDYTGAAETWTVPAGVTQVTFDLYGAGPTAYPNSGKGGRVQAMLAVVPGDTYQILVGGGYGFNGGGIYGGGASDVRSGGFALADRTLVAGGGGPSMGYVFGGDGGYPAGGNGPGGGGGTQTGGGAGGFGYGTSGAAGALGQGGAGADLDRYNAYGGGGGGGYYGGGGGSNCGDAGNDCSQGHGGGGSSYATPAATDVSYENGVRAGNGLVIISYTQPDTSAPVIAPAVSGTLGTNGWYTGDVRVEWSVSDPDSAIASTSGCEPQSITSDIGGTTLTCSATSTGARQARA
jgi:hypothetical protein